MNKASEFRGKVMQHMVAHHLGGETRGSAPALNQVEAQRQNAVQSFWNGMNFRGMILPRVELPSDSKPGAIGDNRSDQVQKAQAKRQGEWNRQSAMPWGSQFMHTQTDKQRLNNPAQASFLAQRQLTVPNTYGQWYAFMHALSAAFGNLNSNG